MTGAKLNFSDINNFKKETNLQYPLSKQVHKPNRNRYKSMTLINSSFKNEGQGFSIFPSDFKIVFPSTALQQCLGIFSCLGVPTSCLFNLCYNIQMYINSSIDSIS
ncbi:hypothetical protein CEXT_448771 [Caerostris extrusa]|uniref:Uncharacterized protein n=1 Tax=Caerostris extrusa TaxID=172846 RepID=A0AAV4RQV7_CAEEX|nr:hypothetical protein CEXT_448771 [Caerostris extrusa]